MHLKPFMCGTPGCHVRKGDKHQMIRHRRSQHPNESALLYREQDQDPVALRQYKLLNERNLGYERVTKICRATTLAELDEPWDRAACASPANPVEAESPLLSAPPPAPVAAGLGLSPGLFDLSPVPGSKRNSITFSDHLPTGSSTGNGAGIRLPSLDAGSGGGGDGDATASEFNDVAIVDFVNKVLVPMVDKMHLQSTPQASRDEHLGRLLRRLMSTAQAGLDRLERRRSTGEYRSRRHPLPLFFRCFPSGAAEGTGANANGPSSVQPHVRRHPADRKSVV